jgi:hypothetical protein
MSTARLRELAPLVKEAGLKISRDLGYRPPQFASDVNHFVVSQPNRQPGARRAAIDR